ncbi:MAG: cupin domain-containing protein [Candidatus Thorarchaeota archaeon]|nr:cupin domain-containing protein [Candidatus Thorarchaeota archaeon]
MKEIGIYNMNEISMNEIRKDLTKNISGHSLIPEGLTSTKVVITKVGYDGEFSMHQDGYHHIFYFISGTGIGRVGSDEYIIRPGTIVEVPAGTLHSYKNTSEEPLFLVTINIPVS